MEHIICEKLRDVGRQLYASASGAWLKQMGFEEVHTLTLDTADSSLAPPPPTDESGPSTVDGAALENILAGETGIAVDIRTSVQYRRGHVPGAWFLTRARMDEDYLHLPSATDIVLIADEPDYTALVITDLESRGRRVWLLEGAMNAWRRSGREATHCGRHALKHHTSGVKFVH